MANRKEPFEGRETGTAAATTKTLRWTPPDSNRRYCVQRLVVRDNTHNFTSFEVVLRGAGYDRPVCDEHGCVVKYDYWYNEDVWVAGSRTIEVDFAGITSGDILSFILDGYSVDARGEL